MACDLSCKNNHIVVCSVPACKIATHVAVTFVVRQYFSFLCRNKPTYVVINLFDFARL